MFSFLQATCRYSTAPPDFLLLSNSPGRSAGIWRRCDWRIATEWSNGPLEGHINRLKVIKRQMYGRAGFELLKARVLPWNQSTAA